MLKYITFLFVSTLFLVSSAATAQRTPAPPTQHVQVPLYCYDLGPGYGTSCGTQCFGTSCTEVHQVFCYDESYDGLEHPIPHCTPTARTCTANRAHSIRDQRTSGEEAPATFSACYEETNT